MRRGAKEKEEKKRGEGRRERKWEEKQGNKERKG